MRPKVILHKAVSLDGRTDLPSPDVRLFYSLVATWREDATLVGCDTFLKAFQKQAKDDDSQSKHPKRLESEKRPILMVPDSRGRMRYWGLLQKEPFWGEMIAI